MSDLAAWLLEQNDADERAAREVGRPGDNSSDLFHCWVTGAEGLTETGMVDISPTRVLAECEAKRRIVEWHKSWPVLVETRPELVQGSDPTSHVYRMAQQIAWLTQAEYVKRFGTEPPTAPILRLLASVYADRPGYDESWRP